jgi:hypothetical protein
MIEHIIYLGVAVGFIAMPFRRSYSCDTWARRAFFTIAALFIFMAVCGLAIDLHYWDLSRRELSAFWSYMQVVRGFIIGCTFVLLVSGNLFRKKIAKDEAVA